MAICGQHHCLLCAFCSRKSQMRAHFNFLLESNITGRKILVASCQLNGFCGSMWDVIMLIYNGNHYSFSAVNFLSSALLLCLSSCLSSCLFLLFLLPLSSLPIPLAHCPGTFGEVQICVHPKSCCELLVVFQQW